MLRFIIPYSEFSEAELRITIAALEHYLKSMDETAYIYDTASSLLDAMKLGLGKTEIHKLLGGS
jgi:hypothetical protein